MGCFRYCNNPKCDAGFDKPTAREDLIDGVVCFRCGSRLRQWQTVEEWLAEMDERVTAIEEKIKCSTSD